MNALNTPSRSRSTVVAGVGVLVVVVAAGLYWVAMPGTGDGMERPVATSGGESSTGGTARDGAGTVVSPQPAPMAARSAPMAAAVPVARSLAPARPVGPIPDERVYRFFNRADRDAFARVVQEQGGEVLGALPIGNALRVRAPGEAAAESWRRAGPMPVGEERNYYIVPPDDPLLVKREPAAGYEAVLAGVLERLGVDTRDADRGYGVTVAVLDTAVGRHPALQEGRILRVGGAGIDPDGPMAAHGTAVASLIAGDGNGVKGIAPGARIVSVPVMNGDGRGDTFSLAQGILEAVRLRANIINLSLGATGDSGVLREAIGHAMDNQAVVVAAVGNDGVNAVAYPARYAGVVAVGAVDARGRHLFFSNRGGTVDLAAPGYAVSAAWDRDGVVAFSGTSAAAPIVSGALAVLLWAERGLDPIEAAERLIATADDAGAPGHDEEYGAGLVNLRRAREFDDAGIVDMVALEPAVVTPVGAAADATTVYIGAQNRGTVSLREVLLRAVADGVPQEQTFRNVHPGQTIHFEYDLLPAGEQARSTTLVYEAIVQGPGDQTPDDNGRRVVMTVAPGEREAVGP